MNYMSGVTIGGTVSGEDNNINGSFKGIIAGNK
jgi:hypothetical protein